MAVLGPKKLAGAMSAASMVEKYLRSRGVHDERALAAMEKIPRHHFVPEAFRGQAYADGALPIGEDQTISQPFIVALMTQELKLTGSERVLEIGTGSGYQTAILAELVRSVFSVERIHSLAQAARKRLEDLDYHNVSVRVANGRFGWAEYAPYDAIVVTASASTIPEDLFQQLRPEGRLVVPMGGQGKPQELILFETKAGKRSRRVLCECSFVPLVD